MKDIPFLGWINCGTAWSVSLSYVDSHAAQTPPATYALLPGMMALHRKFRVDQMRIPLSRITSASAEPRVSVFKRTLKLRQTEGSNSAELVIQRDASTVLPLAA